MENKYGAKSVTIDGHVFPSKRESEYYLAYKDMLERGEIINLELQPRFILIPAYTTRAGKKVRPCHYTADFLLTYPDGRKKSLKSRGSERGIICYGVSCLSISISSLLSSRRSDDEI